jgi:hypothetical protein
MQTELSMVALMVSTPILNKSIGNGVYNAFTMEYSITYTRNSAFGSFGMAISEPKFWAGSVLNLKQIISVNEIAKVKSRFVQETPFLVVPSDLLRPRYLIVNFESPSGELPQSAGARGEVQTLTPTNLSYNNVAIKLPGYTTTNGASEFQMQKQQDMDWGLEKLQSEQTRPLKKQKLE